jgi:hypothetical protein
MPTEQIIALLRAERDRLDAALRALEGGATAKRRGRPRKIVDWVPSESDVPDWVKGKTAAPKKTGRRKFSAAQRKAQAEKMKAYWAARKKAEKKTAKAGA